MGSMSSVNSLARHTASHPGGGQGVVAPSEPHLEPDGSRGRALVDLTAELVSEHYQRHCAWAGMLDVVAALFEAAETELLDETGDGGSEVGAPTSDQLLAIARWVEDNAVVVREQLAAHVQAQFTRVEQPSTPLPSAVLLAEHLRERAWLCGLFDLAGSVYAHRLDASALTHAGAWFTGGITPRTVRLFPRHDERVEVVSMPLDWALAFYAAQL